MTIATLDSILSLTSVLGFLAVVLMFIPVLRRMKRRKEAESSQALTLAVDFWKTALEKGHNERASPALLARFSQELRAGLIDQYANQGFIPDIGVYYFKPYQFGVDPIIWRAMRRAGIVSALNRDLVHHLLTGWARMRVSPSYVAIIAGDGVTEEAVLFPALTTK